MIFKAEGKFLQIRKSSSDRSWWTWVWGSQRTCLLWLQANSYHWHG